MDTNLSITAECEIAKIYDKFTKEYTHDQDRVYCTDESHVRLLHDADYIDQNIARNEHPHLIKKYSDQWKDLVKESLLT